MKLLVVACAVVALWWLDGLIDPPLPSKVAPELLHLDTVCCSKAVRPCLDSLASFTPCSSFLVVS